MFAPNMRYKPLVILLSLIAFCLPSKAQETDSLELKVYFHLSKWDMDLGYMNNADNIRKFVDRYMALKGDPNTEVQGLYIISAASPEGYDNNNDFLSDNRAKSFINYLRGFVTTDDLNVKVISRGSDWGAFRKEVEASNYYDKDKILAIIDGPHTYETIAGKQVDSRITALKSDPAIYKYLESFILPYQRCSQIKLRCTRTGDSKIWDDIHAERGEPAPAQPPVVVVAPPVEPAPVEQPAEVKPIIDSLPLYRFVRRTDVPVIDHYKLILAFRTNLLLPLLNVGMEIPLGNRWSIGVDHYYPWLWRYWPTKTNQYCYEMMWEQLEFRYWFGEKHTPGEKNYTNRLQGHSMGLFGMGGYYDVGQNYQGHQGEFWSVGLDYLYAMPICKGRMHLEFSLGIGYLHSESRGYSVYQKGGELYRIRTDDKTRNWFGPVKANVSLVFPLYKRWTSKYVTRYEKD